MIPERDFHMECAEGASKVPRRPPMEKINRKLRFAIGCINVSVGAHALGKDVAYNADERVGPHAPHSSLLIL